MITRSYDHRGEQYLTAIGIVPAGPGAPARGVKYRRIRNQETKLYRFEQFLRKAHPGITHVNYYGRRTRSFAFQRIFENDIRYRTEYIFRVLPGRTAAPAAARSSKTQQVQPIFRSFALTRSADLQDVIALYQQYIPW